MVNVRVFPFVAPNEEPKWLVLVICALWMGLAAAWLWFKRTSLLHIEKPSLVSLLLMAFTTILAIGVFIGPNMTEGMIRFAFWFFCILIMLTASWASRHEASWMNALTWALSIGSFVFSMRYWWSYILDFGTPGYNIHVLFSPIGHVNFTGDVLIMLLPALIWMLGSKSNPTLRVINWFSVTTIVTILLVASSRGALGGLLLALIVLIILSIKHYRVWAQLENKKQYILPITLITSTFLASYLVYSALPFHYRDLARLSATAGQTVTGEGKIELTPHVIQPPLANMWSELSPLLGARTSIFAATTAMALETPLLGQGTGNYAWVYPNFSNRYPDFRDPLSSVSTFTTNPHNVALQIASQNGIPAMLIFMGLLLFFWYRLISCLYKTWNGWYAAGVVAITAVIFDAMFNHVFFNPASMFVFALLAGTWWGSLPAVQKTTLSVNPRMAASFAIISIVLLSIWPLRWAISEWHTGQAMAYMKYPSYEAAYYQKAYAWDKENFRAVFGMGQVAYKQKKYAKSAEYFEAFKTFYPYNPPALNMLGAAYMSNAQYSKAEIAFKDALTIYPGFEMVEQNLKRTQIIIRQQLSQTPFQKGKQ